MEYEDKVIVCGDCGKEFTHTADDQRRYAERGFTEAPKRCRECRQARKDKAAQAGPRRPSGGGGGERRGGPRREFRGPPRDRGGGGYRSGGGGYGGGGHGRGQREGGGGYARGSRPSFEAVCAACGITTTVPFEPTQGREVFCRDCYRKMKEE